MKIKSIQELENIPKYITHLEFDNDFNKPINKYPKRITNIVFGKTFNQSVDNLPNQLTNLTFGNNFSRSVNFIPDSIQIIYVKNKKQKKLIPEKYQNKLTRL